MLYAFGVMGLYFYLYLLWSVVCGECSMVHAFWCIIQGLWMRGLGLGFRVQGSGFRVQGLGFGV